MGVGFTLVSNSWTKLRQKLRQKVICVLPVAFVAVHLSRIPTVHQLRSTIIDKHIAQLDALCKVRIDSSECQAWRKPISGIRIDYDRPLGSQLEFGQENSGGGCGCINSAAIWIGIIHASIIRAQSQALPDWQAPGGGKMAFDVASVKLDKGQKRSVSRLCIISAFGLYWQMLGPSPRFAYRSESTHLGKWMSTD